MPHPAGRVVSGVLLLAGALVAGAPAVAHRAEHRPASGVPVMEFTPPAPGTYRLPAIQAAPDGRVLDTTGAPRRLAAYTRGRITFLALMYASCTDPTGCPLAHAAMLEVRARVLSDPALRGHVRLVSLSFDPAHDSPAAMRAYAGALASAAGPLPWHFLTTRGPRDLAPILDGLGQEVAVERDAAGRPTRTLSHMLKLFLLDRQARVREIYTTGFLHPEVVLNDIRTLRWEEREPVRAALGRKLFLDRRLSPNGTMSCAMCHVPEQGFTANELATPVGIEGRGVRRNAPTLLDVAFQRHLFHDGRETTLEAQVWGPLLAPNEMGNASREAVVERILGLADYRGRFEAAFGEGVSATRIGEALAAYQRTLLAGESRFDRWRGGGAPGALDATELHGLALFAGKARCAGCHRLDDPDGLLTDHEFHDTGIGWRRAMAPAEPVRVQLAPGVFAELEPGAVEALSGPSVTDEGRYEVTGDPRDRWAYRTPSLRNVALTAPYMHDGSLPTLEAVVELYDRGGIDSPGKSPRLAPLGLSAGERAALVAFLRALTGRRVPALVAAARRP